MAEFGNDLGGMGGDDFSIPQGDYDSYIAGERNKNFYQELRESGFNSERELYEHMAEVQGIDVEDLIAALNEGNEGQQLPRQKPNMKELGRKPNQNPNQQFSPIKFQGEYDELGQVSLDINSREQLEGYLEKALIAEKVYEKYENLQAEFDSIKEDAEVGRALQEKLDNSPSQFLTETLRDLMFTANPKDVLMFLSKTYHELDAIAKDPNLYRAEQLEWNSKYKAPQEQDSRVKNELNKIQEERNKFTLDVETKKLESWKMGMVGKYKQVSDYISQVSGDNKWFDKYLNIVMEKGMNQVRSGKTFGPKQLEAELTELIGPVYKSFQKMQKPGTMANTQNQKFKPQMNTGTGKTTNDSAKKAQDIINKYRESLYR